MARTYCSFRVRVTFQSQFNTSQILYPKQLQPVHSVSIEIAIGIRRMEDLGAQNLGEIRRIVKYFLLQLEQYDVKRLQIGVIQIHTR